MKKIFYSLTLLLLSLTSCSDDEPSDTKTLSGSYTGTNTVAVGQMFNGTADITCRVVDEDGVLTVHFPEYVLPGSFMGDLTLGAVTISGISYDAAKGAYYRLYGPDGVKQSFKAEKDGTVTINKEYVLAETSEITVVETATGISVTNTFQMGSMPFPITSTFVGSK